jgi:hypothetical protein
MHLNWHLSINDVFKAGQLDSKSNMQKMHIANSDKPVGISPKRIMAVREKKKIGANKG